MKLSAIKLHLGIVLLTLLTLYLSLYFPTDVYTEQQLRNVELGWPTPFVVQDSAYDPELPVTYHYSTPREHPTHMNYISFAFSFVLVFIWLEIFVWVLSRACSMPRL